MFCSKSKPAIDSSGGHAIPLLVIACLLTCTHAVRAAETPSAQVFSDRTAALGLQLPNGGACWADLNNDGWPDLCAGGVAWRNDAGKSFAKIAEGLGDVVAADFDNDGWTDLFSLSSLRVLRSDAGKAFAPVAMPELPKCVCRGACWGDFNGDGLVDLYVGGYEDWDAGITYPNMILMNERGKGFKLAWSEVRYRSRGVTACDFDQDGDLDIYVSNYRLQPNVLWMNNGTGAFTDAAPALNAAGTSPGFEGGHSIGAAWGDFDNDGIFDLFVGNFAHVDGRGDQPKSRFLRQPGPAKGNVFEDRGPCGVFYQESYASPAAGDCDNDGDLDLFFTTVYEVASFNRKNFPGLFRNDGNFAFSDITAAAGVASLPPTYQAAWADFDQDGDLDLVTAGRLFQNGTIAENKNGAGHWLGIRLAGDGTTVNRSAIGTQVRVKLGDRTLARQVEAGTGEGNQNDLGLHFGLGSHSLPVSIDIVWPDGTKQSVNDVAVDSLLTQTYVARK